MSHSIYTKSLSSDLETHNIYIKVARTVTVPLLNSLPAWVIKMFMKKSSKDASVVVAKGGSTHALEAMYNRFDRKLFSRGILQGFSDILWHHIVSQPKALRNRLKIVQRILEEKVSYLMNSLERKEISILSIAGGSSRSILYSLHHISDVSVRNNIHVVTIDKDKSALDIGENIAKEYNLQNNFDWICGNAKEINTIFPNRKFDIIEIVGLIDYFDENRAVRLISLSRDLLNIGGFIIIANVMPNSEKIFVHKTGWPNMFYRKSDEVRELLIKSGFDLRSEVIIEPLNIHCIGIGQK